jgi:uncharacterized protein
VFPFDIHDREAMSLPGCLKPSANGVYLFVKVQPRASRNEFGEIAGDELKLKVTAPPVDAAANEAVVKMLAEVFGCARGAVQITRGQTSRHKTIFISGVTAEGIAKKLSAPSQGVSSK